MGNESAEQRFELEARLSRRAAIDFGGHVLVSALLTLSIFAATAGISWTGVWLQANTHLDAFAIATLKLIEYVLLCIDAFLFVVYLARTGYTFLRNLFSHDARKS